MQTTRSPQTDQLYCSKLRVSVTLYYKNTSWLQNQLPTRNSPQFNNSAVTFTSLSLSRSQSAFHDFVSAIRARGGGGDGPEDIMGALKVVFRSLSWRSEGSKVCQAIRLIPRPSILWYNNLYNFFCIHCSKVITVCIVI